jgi:DNA-binding transcriptional LysR family regulator
MTNPRSGAGARRAPAPAPAAAKTADRIALMQTFVRIVEAGSLSAAAAQLGATQPTVSRRLQALEQALGVRLLQRSTHAMKLTEDGERCFEGAKALLGSWAAFESGVRGERERPEGTLRVIAPHALGQEQLIAPLVAWLRRHPGVAVEWNLRDETQGLIAEGIDCAIQVGEVSDPALVAVKLSQVQRIVVGAPALTAGARAPKDPAALAQLPWLALRTYYRNEVSLARIATGERRRFAIRPRLATDSLFALRSAALAGLGACLMSTWLAADDLAHGRLLHLAPQWRAAPLPVYLVYPHARFYPARLRRFVEAMREAMPAVLGAEAAGAA